MKRLKAKKRAQAKKKSQAKKEYQSEEVPVKEEITTKEEIPANGKDPAKGQSTAREDVPAKGQGPAAGNQWKKYPIETEFIAKMEPLSYPVTRDLEHEVLCDFNLDDAFPVARYMPMLDCLQGTSLLLMQNWFAVELT